ncbi:MAG: pyridoxine 5'-phosphate synthase [Planctomycetes bacterium]|nr:pyridoxine 5'-phosphate synthase [Planctomycetota bacterium]
MPLLHVNIDHIATVRQARRASEPDPVAAAAVCELAGADGITVHLREDRRHIQDRDVRLLRSTVKTILNLESSLADEMIAIACDVRPDEVCLVPENRREITTEGGLDAATELSRLKSVVARLHKAGILVSVFVDPDERQVQASRDAGADFVELHTGQYSGACSHRLATSAVHDELDRLSRAAAHGRSIGLRVNAGHGLDYKNARPVASIPQIEELNIGFSIIARSVFVGLDAAVREMKQSISNN